MARSRRLKTWLEIGALAALILSYIWGWSHAFPGHFAVVVLLFFAIGLEMHITRRESPQSIGFRLDNAGPAARNALLWIGTPVAIILAATALWGTWHYPPPLQWPLSIGLRCVWGTAQQYGLLCLFYRRLREVLPPGPLPILSGGLLFALFHLPNPFLTLVALAAGTLSCWLYERVCNAWVLGVAHGLVSFVLTFSFSAAVTMNMRVGPAVLRHL